MKTLDAVLGNEADAVPSSPAPSPFNADDVGDDEDDAPPPPGAEPDVENGFDDHCCSFELVFAARYSF